MLVTQIVLARLFGPQAFGLYAVGWTLMRLAALASLLGLDTAVIRYGTVYLGRELARLRQVLMLGVGVPLVVGLLAGSLIFAAAPALAEEVFANPQLAPILRWFAVGIGPFAAMQAAAAATRISKRMRYAVLSEELLQPAGALLLIVLFGALGWGILGAAVATVLSGLLALGLALYFVFRLFGPAFQSLPRAAATWRELLTYAVTVSGSRLFVTFIIWIDRLVLGFFRPAAEVGVYQTAAQASVLFAIILSSFNYILSPLAADLWYRNERDRLQDIYRISTKWGLYLSLPLFVVMWALPADILRVVFGPQYQGGAMALRLLAVGQLINAGTGGVGLLLSLTGHHVTWVRTAGAMFVVGLLLNLILAPRLGLLGSAIATSAALSGTFLIGLSRVRSVLALWPYDARYLKGLVAAALSAAALYLLGQLMVTHSLSGLIVATLVTLIVFVGVLLLLGLDAEDQEFLSMVRTRIRLAAGGGDP